MKKLLVAAIGVATAVGAFADTISTKRFEEGTTVGNVETISSLNTLAGGTDFWSDGSAISNVYKIGAVDALGGIASQPTPLGTPTKALDVATRFGEPLNLNIQDGGTTTNIPNSGLYFDSLVKFTVCDGDPDEAYYGQGGAYEGAKIVMWLKSEDDINTNLMVRAGYLSFDNGVKVTNKTYTCAVPSGFDASGFNRVTIKAISDITAGGLKVPAFAIYINGKTDGSSAKLVSCNEAKWDNTFTADLTPTAADLNSSLKKGLFPSLVQTGGLKTQLASVSFDGTGAITDLAFTDVAPEFAADVADPEVTGVYVDGVEQDIGTLADAITAVNGASTSAAIKLNKTFAITEPLVFTANATITLDFAGFVLTNTQAYAAITNSAANLVVTNSTGKGGVYCTQNGIEAIYQTAATFDEGAVYSQLSITGGNFWGYIGAEEGAAKIAVSGGAFGMDPMDLEEIVEMASGKAISEEVNADGLYEVIEAPEPEPTWATYLGEPVDGAYEIDDLNELKAFQANVGVLATEGETFELTTNIELDEAWPGIGIQNGKDIWNQTSFNEGAFCGTFDGKGYTISGFQMVGVAGNPKDNGEGLDYCGFFNSIYGATIKNLKIQYAGALFAADTASDTKESGATFVGVAKESTLQNLTSLQKDSSTAVSCSKGFGGIVGFVTSGTTVEYCTNNVNITSLASNKAGGIAMITQGGTGTATIRNCVNNGTTTGNNTQKGGIIGYVGADGSVAIADCTDTAGSEPTFYCWNKGTVTVSGVNKASASVVPVKNQSNGSARAVNGLTFATVDGDVATFVADNALAAGNTYKVMAPGTATYNFTAAGTIAFNTALATPTYAITAGSGLELTDATVGTVKTYTAAEPSTPEVVPGGDPVVVDESKTNTITTAVIQPPTTGAETYTPAEVTAYQSLFKVTFTPQLGGSGFVVGAELDESLPAVQAIVGDLTDAVETIPLADVVAGDDDATVEIDAVPGLYYGVATGTTLENMAVSTWKQAKTGNTKLSLDVPAKGESQAAGFYRIEASATGK